MRAALLTPSAHFVKPDCRNRADKCEAGCERKQERQHVVAESQPQQHDARERVDEAKEDNVRSIRREIVEAFNQRVPEVGGLDPTNSGHRGVLALLAPAQRATQRSHGQSRKRELTPTPLDGVSDMVLAGHLRTSRTSSSRAAGHPWLRSIGPLVASEPRPHWNHTPILGLRLVSFSMPRRRVTDRARTWIPIKVFVEN